MASASRPAGHGAQVGPEDIEAVVSYLTTNFGPGVPLPGPAPAPVTLPDGPGKQTVEGGCAMCHGLGLVAAAKRSPAQWQLIVNKMVFYGAPLSPEQANTVAAYLGAQFGTK
jgi:mono/diheme cytochrome c family protein